MSILNPNRKSNCVYLVRCGDFNLYKIGRTINDNFSRCQARINGLQAANPFPLTLLTYKIVNNAKKLEGGLHKQYWKERVRGEWFKLNEQQVENILKMLS